MTCSIFLLDRIPVRHLVKGLSASNGTRRFVIALQEYPFPTNPVLSQIIPFHARPEPNNSIPRLSIYHLKTNFNSILSSKHKVSKSSLSLGLPQHHTVGMYRPRLQI